MDQPFSIDEFRGVARLFPLPNLVLFPHVVQPLRIFEPRYRQMTEHALSSDRLIAMVLIRPGTHIDYLGKPEIFDTACLGRIIHDQRQANGEFHLLLRGLCRLRIEREISDDHLYRSAYAEVLEENVGNPPAKLRRSLIRAARNWFPTQGMIAQQIDEIFQSDMPLGALCDMLAFALPLPIDLKQSLLEELNARRRSERLLDHLAHATPPEALPMPREKRKFPPDFSHN